MWHDSYDIVIWYDSFGDILITLFLRQKEAEAMEAWEKVSVENHDLSKELKRLKRDLDDTCATLDEQKRQNKSMGDENQNLSKSFLDLALSFFETIKHST